MPHASIPLQACPTTTLTLEERNCRAVLSVDSCGFIYVSAHAVVVAELFCLWQFSWRCHLLSAQVYRAAVCHHACIAWFLSQCIHTFSRAHFKSRSFLVPLYPFILVLPSLETVFLLPLLFWTQSIQHERSSTRSDLWCSQKPRTACGPSWRSCSPCWTCKRFPSSNTIQGSRTCVCLPCHTEF